MTNDDGMDKEEPECDDGMDKEEPECEIVEFALKRDYSLEQFLLLCLLDCYDPYEMLAMLAQIIVKKGNLSEEEKAHAHNFYAGYQNKTQ